MSASGRGRRRPARPEAAYALHKFGLQVTVVELFDRLLGRQLDERGSYFLRKYLEGLGFEIIVKAETAAVEANGRVSRVRLRDERTCRATSSSCRRESSRTSRSRAMRGSR